MVYVSSHSGEACKLLYPSLLYFTFWEICSIAFYIPFRFAPFLRYYHLVYSNQYMIVSVFVKSFSFDKTDHTRFPVYILSHASAIGLLSALLDLGLNRFQTSEVILSVIQSC